MTPYCKLAYSHYLPSLNYVKSTPSICPRHISLNGLFAFSADSNMDLVLMMMTISVCGSGERVIN